MSLIHAQIFQFCQRFWKLFRDPDPLNYLVIFNIQREVKDLGSLPWMRSSRVVRAFDCQCKFCNSPGFNPSIHRHSEIWRVAYKAVSSYALFNKIQKNPPVKKEIRKSFSLCAIQNIFIKELFLQCTAPYSPSSISHSRILSYTR